MRMISDSETVLMKGQLNTSYAAMSIFLTVKYRNIERDLQMNTSLSWIKTYVPDLDVTAQEYTDAMTLTGTKVEGFERLDADLIRS